MAQAREMREARRSEPMPELKGRVVYARRDREKEERLQTRQTPQHHTVPFTHSPAQEHYTNDGMISELELERQAGLAEVISPVKLPAIDAIPAMSAKAGRITRAQILRAWLMQWVKRISAILSRLRGPRLTKTGKQALAQLQRLYSLVSADYGDDSMEMVQLRVAFGEAYFHMMQASHRHHKHSRGRGKEDYGAYFDQFLRGAPE